MIDSERRPIGVITLTDVLKVLVGFDDSASMLGGRSPSMSHASPKGGATREMSAPAYTS